MAVCYIEDCCGDQQQYVFSDSGHHFIVWPILPFIIVIGSSIWAVLYTSDVEKWPAKGNTRISTLRSRWKGHRHESVKSRRGSRAKEKRRRKGRQRRECRLKKVLVKEWMCRRYCKKKGCQDLAMKMKV